MIETLPATLPVKALDAKHPDYAEMIDEWDHIELLSCGGHKLKQRVQAGMADILWKRPKELTDVYTARCQRFTYQNILGTAIGWYQSALFEREPEAAVKGEDGKSEASQELQDWYGAWFDNCDRAGCEFTALYGSMALDLMKFGRAFRMAELPAKPAAEGEPPSLEAQRAAGLLDPYIVRYDPRQVINWACDAYGNLDWVVVATSETRREVGKSDVLVSRWYLWDRKQFAVYEAEQKAGAVNIGGQDDRVAIQTAVGPHSMADQNRVPLRMLCVPEGHWLAGRAYLQAMDHLNMDNAYSWSLFMSCLPVPVIKGEFNGNQTVSETAYIQLEAQGEFKYAETSGVSYEHSARRIASLREEIYRQMYLQAQAKDASATASQQSGYSKEQDMVPSQSILAKLGDILKDDMEHLLDDVAAIRGDSVSFAVSGFDFEGMADPQEIEFDQATLDLGVPSLEFKRALWKRAVRRSLKDASEELLAKIDGEIDAAEDPAEVARKQMQQKISAGLQAATQQPVGVAV